jgi:hypothetical protein
MSHNRGNGERRGKGCRTLGAERSVHLDVSSAIGKLTSGIQPEEPAAITLYEFGEREFR